MKYACSILFIVLNIIAGKAEYSGWYIKFKITTTENKILEGNAYIASAYFDEDSTSSISYMVNRFDRLDYKPDSVITFYRSRITHTYKKGHDTLVAYSLVDKETISIFKVSKIEIIQKIEYSYQTNVANELSMKDTAWLNTPLLKHEWVGGYLCEYDLFVHERSKELDKLLDELKRKSKKAEEAKMDSILTEIIEKIIKYKVLVVSHCSC